MQTSDTRLHQASLGRWADAAVVLSNSVDPWYNLAWEEMLLVGTKQKGTILYLWQNQNTVVIGRNQNAWKECRHELLAEEGGKLARRLSGGGAVYHDLGNLNFTFITSRKAYNLDKQLQVILNAAASLGIPAEFSGRNDILAQGRKFSGNAFYKHGDRAYHHGTILIAADFDKMGRYLQVSKEKMATKGISSVQSRVVNLSELNPGVDVESMKQALVASFKELYTPLGDEVAFHDNLEQEYPVLKGLYEKYASWEWRFGQTPAFDLSLEHRFPWGGIELGLKLAGGKIEQATIFSDAMEPHLILALGPAMEGRALEKNALQAALDGLNNLPDLDTENAQHIIQDIADWLISVNI
ncbi:MAG: lipoate--protein ligase [Firmicutes bacterium]|nr:lipoate--protein ligase [Bacillota bacterium]